MTPARNRVTPLADIEAIALRGAWMGNRGILHRGREIECDGDKTAYDDAAGSACSGRIHSVDATP